MKYLQKLLKGLKHQRAIYILCLYCLTTLAVIWIRHWSFISQVKAIRKTSAEQSDLASNRAKHLYQNISNSPKVAVSHALFNRRTVAIVKPNLICETTPSAIVLQNFTKNTSRVISSKCKQEYRARIKEREEILQQISQYNSQHQREKHLPGVIGIGVKKCGTDGVIRYLDKHPLIKVPWDIDSETAFFSNRYGQGAEYYKSLFPKTNDKEIGMEKTPVYFDHPPSFLPDLIQSIVPKVKLLLIVCDPTLRAFSDYVHERIRYQLYRDQTIAKYHKFGYYVDTYLPKLEELVREGENNFSDVSSQITLSRLHKTDRAATLISNGLYVYHIQRWKKIFNGTNLMIIDGEQFMEDTGSVIEKIQDFISVPRLLWKEDFVKHPDTGYFCYRQLTALHLNESFVESSEVLRSTLECLPKAKGRTRKKRKPLAARLALRRLQKFYNPFNHAFYQEVNQDFNWL